MAFDQITCGRLQRFVDEARSLLTAEFRRQLPLDYGLDLDSGEVRDLDQLTHLDNARRDTAGLLRETLDHYLASSPKQDKKARVDALSRIVREQAFTVLNRLCALRMAEARDLLIESVGGGYQSRGFHLYQRLAGTALGETGEAYRSYLFSVCDEIAVDLPVLFDRFSPHGRLFPREVVLLELLGVINHADMTPLWTEDETIGWIYQYFNTEQERRQMRAESAAPRNSRELAVRNQFFTPRYVVEFLTDNTLGRIWYEMTQGQTILKDTCRYLVRRPNEILLKENEQPPKEKLTETALSQEELLKQPVYIPFRPLKDPRDILMLDPACGSMHFGLYAFDLFEHVYAEAWDLEERRVPNCLVRPEGPLSLRESYPSKDDLLRDVPRLIIERNIHGIDIDPRAVQIAGLSLWLRAQKSWENQGVKPQDRPAIQRSNIVCAEPMPGEESFLKEFIEEQFSADAEGRLLGQLVQYVFETMKLAGEAGSLLKIEEEIATSVSDAKQKWLARPKGRQGLLFSEAGPVQGELGFEVAGVTDDAFWEEAEGKIYTALRRYSEQAETGRGYQRRLFADDTARGFAFIDLCRRRYDVVLMNPPFGEPSVAALTYFRSAYPIAADNLLIAFVQRFHDSLTQLGKLGAITDRSWINKRFYEAFRRDFVLATASLETWVDLGWNVLDANVEVAAHVHSHYNRLALFSNVSQSKDKELELLRTLQTMDTLFIHELGTFSRFPGWSIVYDLESPLVQTFANGSELGQTTFTSYGGLKAGESERCFRLLWEVPVESLSDKSWALFQNGSPFSPYYYGCYYVVRCDQEKWSTVLSHESSRVTNIDHYFEPGIFYGKRTEWMYGYKGRKGQVPSMEGHLVLPLDWDRCWLALLIINSSVYQEIANKLCGQHKYAGYINPIRLEVCRFPDWSDRAAMVTMQLEMLEQGNEVSGLFLIPLSLKLDEKHIGMLHASLSAAVDVRREVVAHGNELRSQYNQEVEAEFHWKPKAVNAPLKVDYVRLLFESSDSPHLEASCLASYVVGVAYGRWDIRFPTGGKAIPDFSDAFASLPVCPPGQLQNEQGLPVTKGDVERFRAEGQWIYPIEIPWDGILVDDPGQALDIEARVQQVLQVIWTNRTEAIERELCDILAVGGLRDYFRRPVGFFAEHLKQYSKSRRQAPIYWPLSTPSGSYTLWIYYHRLTDQTLYTCVNEFLDHAERGKLKQVAEETRRLRQKNNRSTAEEKELEQLTDLELELKDFRDELLRIAKFWRPNLNDGVIITAAPLWKLFRYKPWQKRLKEAWAKLEQGEYDWAHLAYSIWPERVREKCKTDKSLAIAHGLEELYQAPLQQPKQKRGRRATQEVEVEADED